MSDSEEMEGVLFDYKGVSTEISLQPNLIREIESYLLTTERKEVKVICVGEDTANLEIDKDVYYIQKWSKKWNRFVTVSSVGRIDAKDIVSVTKAPQSQKSPQKATVTGGSSPGPSNSALRKIMVPNESEVKELAQFFPSYRSSINASKPISRRKPGPKRSRPFNTSVVVMKTFSPFIPRGQSRQELAKQSRIQSILLNRDMTNGQVREKIAAVFKCPSDITLLECAGSGSLCKCGDQEIDGNRAADRKGSLYLCEEFENVPTTAKPKKVKPRKLSPLPLSDSDSDFISLPPKTKSKEEASNSKEPVKPIKVSSDSDKELLERRALIKEQDDAYLESLAMDRAKSLRRSHISEVKDQLREKWNNVFHSKIGYPFILRLPCSKRMKVSIPSDCGAQGLYEIVLAHSGLEEGFSLFTTIPRQFIPPSMDSKSCAALSRVLSVETTREPLDLSVFSVKDSPKVEESTLACPSALQSCALIHEIEEDRSKFMDFELIGTRPTKKHHLMHRDRIYEEMIDLYTDALCEVIEEYPIRFELEGESAYDTGGVCREVYSCFWNAAYSKHFDGDRLLTPAVSPGVNQQELKALGTILSHGFLVCGFLPIRVAFPIIAAALHGPDVKIEDPVIIESFFDFISSYESDLLREAYKMVKQGEVFSKDTVSRLVNVFSRFDCTSMPSATGFKTVVVQIARHILLGKPLGLLFVLNSGVPKTHSTFWKRFSVEKLFSLYRALNATPDIVLHQIEEPEFENMAESKVYYYLRSYIGNAKNQELRSFLRFVTGSSVILDKKITIAFNTASGLGRRPTSHTCDCQIELPTTYETFLEFESDFNAILAAESTWLMDAV